MRKLAAAVALLSLVAVSCETHRTKADRLVENYAVVKIPAPDLSGITDNGKEVLNLYRFAADEVDKIYWKQNFGDKEALLGSIADPAAQLYAEINYGPWDRIDGKPFVEGYGAKPAGAGFYPADLTAAEFEAYPCPYKSSPYTLIVRDGDSLKTVWYHDAYAESIGKIADYLQAAADITIKPSVREYLLKKIEGLKTDDYYESDKAWLEMTDSKMDLVIGPNEAVDDALYGTKASYGAYVLLKNLERTEELNALSARLPEFQEMLPGDPAHRDFVPGAESNIFSCNVLYCSGYTNAGFKVIAINFPYDAKVQEELGTRTIGPSGRQRLLLDHRFPRDCEGTGCQGDRERQRLCRRGPRQRGPDRREGEIQCAGHLSLRQGSRRPSRLCPHPEGGRAGYLRHQYDPFHAFRRGGPDRHRQHRRL